MARVCGGGGGEGEELLFLPTPLPLQKWLFSKANISFLFFHILLIAKLLVNLPIFGFFGFKIWFNAIVHNTYIHVLSTSRAICLRITHRKPKFQAKPIFVNFCWKKNRPNRILSIIINHSILGLHRIEKFVCSNQLHFKLSKLSLFLFHSKRYLKSGHKKM